MAELKVSKDGKGLRAFVARHDALFTTLGALLVFVGFYLREVKLEKVDSYNSSLKAAQYNALFDTRTMDLDNKIDSLGAQLTHLQIYGSNASVYGDEYLTIKANADAYAISYDELTATANLLESLPFSAEQLKHRATDLIGQRQKLFPMWKDVSQEANAFNIEALRSHKQIRDLAGFSKFLDSAGTFGGEADQFKIAVTNLQQDADQEGAVQLGRLESESDRATRLSHFLFFVGWVMGLAGKMLKIPALGGDSV